MTLKGQDKAAIVSPAVATVDAVAMDVTVVLVPMLVATDRKPKVAEDPLPKLDISARRGGGFISNRAKKYLPQSNFWTPRNERNEQTERARRTDNTDRTQRDERVVVGSGLTVERPKPKFDRFKKKRAEASSPYGRTEGSSEREEQYGSRKPAGDKPAEYKSPKSRDGQGKAFECIFASFLAGSAHQFGRRIA